MDSSDLSASFPELGDPAKAIARIGQAFITGEQAYSAFTLINGIMRHFGDRLTFGKNAALFPIDEYGSIILMVGDQAVLNFHIVEESELEHDDPYALSGAGYRDMGTGEANGNGADHSGEHDAHVYYQIGILIMDRKALEPESLFEREDLDCREYTADDGNGEDRLYAARFVLELEDLHNPDLVRGCYSAVEYILNNPDQYEPYTDEHDNDLARLFSDSALFERGTDAADFDNVIDL